MSDKDIEKEIQRNGLNTHVLLLSISSAFRLLTYIITFRVLL